MAMPGTQEANRLPLSFAMQIEPAVNLDKQLLSQGT